MKQLLEQILVLVIIGFAIIFGIQNFKKSESTCQAIRVQQEAYQVKIDSLTRRLTHGQLNQVTAAATSATAIMLGELWNW